jgi:hypothetical protein
MKSQTIVVRLKPNHPTSQRRRAGFVFTEQPQAVEVTSDQLKMIQDDSYLMISTKGQTFEQGVANAQNQIQQDDPSNSDDSKLTKAQIIEKLLDKGFIEGEDFDKTAKKDDLLALLAI